MTEEKVRGSLIKGYGVLDTPNEPAFDKIVREAAATIGTPIALISLIDENRQWFKAKVGLSVSETPLSISFCTHAVKQEGVFEIPDAAEDPRFSDNPLVTGNPGIRFYAGLPLRTPGGTRIGTICVIDDQPRAGLSSVQKAHLYMLAERVMTLLEARQAKRDAADTLVEP